MRNPKKRGARKGKGSQDDGPALMAVDGGAAAAAAAAGGTPAVWRPGVDPVGEGEELSYDPTAYDCLHKFSLEWPCLSFDFVKDDLGGPRSTFPHTVFMVAGTQAANPRQNCLAVLRLADLGQGRHGKRPSERAGGSGSDSDSDDADSSEDDDDDGSSSSSSGSAGDEAPLDDEVMDDASAGGAAAAAAAAADGGGQKAPKAGRLTARREGREPPARLHHRLVSQPCGINRVRSCWQRPGLVALWGDTGAVRLLDVAPLLAALAGEAEVVGGAAAKVALNPLFSYAHHSEGFAMDWSRVTAGRLVTGDCKKHIHVWEPQEGGRWQVSPSYNGHSGSVEDLQWSPTEATVFASASTDKSVAIFDTRDRSKAQLQVAAADCDVNVISWNRLVGYMLASGDDAGGLKVWDLRAFKAGAAVSTFAFHKASITSVEWSPYESSMLATSGADNQTCVWDLALERDPEEEAALAPEGNAALAEELPSQLLFVHAGQADVKELHWHAQVPGMLGTTAADGFNLFRPSNL